MNKYYYYYCYFVLLQPVLVIRFNKQHNDVLLPDAFFARNSNHAMQTCGILAAAWFLPCPLSLHSSEVDVSIVHRYCMCKCVICVQNAQYSAGHNNFPQDQ